MNHISLLLLTHNSSNKISRYWNWLSKCPVINEIIQIDNNSTDDTTSQLKKIIPKNINLNTFQRNLDGDFASQRNFGISKSKNEWIFWLDSDETPSTELINFLNKFEFDDSYIYSFNRLDYFLGHPLYHGETASQTFIRLFPKSKGVIQRPVHEVFVTGLPQKNINAQILHYSHDSLKSFMEKINFYSDIRANELHQQKVRSGAVSAILYPLGKFTQNYLFRLGFLDSTPGIIMALGMSFHSFLVRAKLWHLWQK